SALSNSVSFPARIAKRSEGREPISRVSARQKNHARTDIRTRVTFSSMYEPKLYWVYILASRPYGPGTESTSSSGTKPTGTFRRQLIEKNRSRAGIAIGKFASLRR